MQKLNKPFLTLMASAVLSAMLAGCGASNDTSGASTSATASAADNAASAATGNSASTAQNTATPAAGNSASSSLAAKESSIGAVTGFGSVIVEGVKYEDDAATVKVDIDPTQPRTGALGEIKLGMHVEVKAEGVQAKEFRVHAEVMGKISSLGVDSFVVAGQTVKLSSDTANPTVFEGLTKLADLVMGDFVEVYGSRDSAGVVVASRVERKTPGEMHLTRIAGNVASLDKTAKTFVLGGLTINYAQALRILPSIEALANGSKVVVYSNTALVGSTLTAKGIKVNGVANPELEGLLRVGGRIQALDFAAKTFKLDGLLIDASKAKLEKGSLNDLANGLKVRVKGAFADGKVAATELKFVKDQGDAQVDVKGEITDFVSAANFKVRGVPFDASATGLSFTGCDVSKLAAGVFVRIKGEVKADVVKPTSVECLAAPSQLRERTAAPSGTSSVAPAQTAGMQTLNDLKATAPTTVAQPTSEELVALKLVPKN